MTTRRFNITNVACFIFLQELAELEDTKERATLQKARGCFYYHTIMAYIAFTHVWPVGNSPLLQPWAWGPHQCPLS